MNVGRQWSVRCRELRPGGSGRPGGHGCPAVSHRPEVAFTLLEVMIAMGVFFMAVFSILALVSNGLRNAAALQKDYPEASMLAAMLATTNKLEEGSIEGRFEDIAPGLYPGYKYRQDIYLSGDVTNDLWQVDFYIARDGQNWPEKPDLAILLYLPSSRAGPVRMRP